MYRRFLHTLRWVVFGGLYRRYSTVLYLHWSLDVHSIRLEQRSCQKFVGHGSGLDRYGGAEAAMVLHRQWVAVGIWWDSLAGKTFEYCFSSESVLMLST